MDALNHHMADPSEEHPSWPDEMVVVPPSLLSDVLARVDKLSQEDQSSSQPKRILELVEALHDDAWYVRTTAVQELGKLGEPASLSLLLAALQDEHVSVRAATVYALGQLGPYAPIDLLAHYLQDDDWQIRERAVLALCTQEVNAPIELLQAVLYDPDSHVRETARYALQSLSTAPLTESNEPSYDYIPGQMQPIATLTEVSTKRNLLKTIFSRFLPDKNHLQISTGVHVVMEQPSLYNTTITNRQPGQRKPGTRILTSAIIAIAMVTVLFFSWTLALQHLYQQNISSHLGHPISGGNATSIVQPNGSQIPATNQHKPGDTLYTYSDSFHSVYSVAWSPDDKRIVLADGASVISMDALTGAHKIISIGSSSDSYPGFVNTSVSWSPDGSRIAGANSRLYVWDAASGHPIVSYQPPVQATSSKVSSDGVIVSTTWSPDSKLIAFATNGVPYGFNVYVWNPQTQQVVFTQHITTPHASNKSVAWSPDGKYLAFLNGTTVMVWDINQNQLVSQFPGAVFAWSPNSKSIAATDPSDGVAMDGPSVDPNYGPGIVIIWNVATSKEITHFQVVKMSKGTLPIDPIDWSPDGKHLLVVSTDISEWDSATHTNVLHYTGHPSNYSSFPRDVAWSHSGQQVASAGGGAMGQASVKIWVP